MAAELATPIDEVSGIPLPLIPREVLDITDPTVNWHHAWFPKTAPELQDIGGRALRHSRVQLVREGDHNHGNAELGKVVYHDYFHGPALPKTALEKFNSCVLSAAGYIPDLGVDLTADEPVVRPLSKVELSMFHMPPQPRPLQPYAANRVQRRASEQHRALATPKPSRRAFINHQINDLRDRRAKQAQFGLRHFSYNYEALRTFFRSMVLDQDLSDIGELKIEEFLLTRDQERKDRLGRWLIGQATERTTEAVHNPYLALRRKGKLHPRMPSVAHLLVLYKLGAQDERAQLARDHEIRLRQRYALAG